MNAPADPFAHLHDENYSSPFIGKRVGHADMVEVGGRKSISLNGEWRFTLDLFDEGLRQKWYLNDESLPSQWTVPRDYDLGADRTIIVPSCWTNSRPEWRFFEGGAWYTRSIRWSPGTPGERLFLRVGAAACEARIFINGRFVASHLGASTPFFVELTKHMQDGGNRLQIHVDNRRMPDRVPMHHFDWFNHGGIYRDVDLYAVPEIFIRSMRLALVPDGTLSRVRCTVELSSPVNGTADLSIVELKVKTAIPVENGRGELIFETKPDLWSPASPKLYDVSVSFGDDGIFERIGFREIRVEGMNILLNGRPLRFNGTCVHEDDRLLGKATNETDIRRRFEHAKELGCNILRLAHYPHHERVAQIADELGIMLWEEIPVYWAIAFENPATFADADNQLLEMIGRDFNRASIVIWGVGNENADTDARYNFMSALAASARKSDPTRLIAAACLINRETFRIEDRLAAAVDIIGINEYFGWYEPDFTGLEQLLANSKPDRPVIISEFGAEALAGHRGGSRELFTEDAQAEFYRRQFEIIRKTSWIKGTFVWVLYDFYSERRQTVFQKGLNRKGLVAEDKKTKKLAFSVVAEAYRLSDSTNL